MSTTQQPDEVFDRIHESASALLEERGIDGVQVREVAKRANTSTMGVYSRFGGKPGLLDVLYQRGFERLRAAAEPIQGRGTAQEELDRMSDGYRQHALASPRHYDLMFGRGVPGFEPSKSARAAALASFDAWVASVRRATDAGLLVGNVETNAFRLWALNHGFVSLELSGMAQKGSERTQRRRHREAYRALLEGLRP
jgi:AcrR family transcriptional regulator